MTRIVSPTPSSPHSFREEGGEAPATRYPRRMTRPGLTICICTHDRPEDVRACLAGLAAQSVPTGGLDILVIDSGSPPASATALAVLVVSHPGARLIRLDAPGLSAARNAGAAAAAAPWIAYLDDDAVPAPDWAEAALAAIATAGAGPGPPPGLIGGRVLPAWEAPLPSWWPPRLRGVLSIVEHEGQGAYGTPELPAGLEPCGANMLVHGPALRTVGGFSLAIGRRGAALLSDEEVHLARRLRDAGHLPRYDSRLVVHHRIRAARLTPAWLLSRLRWQGVSAVRTRVLLGEAGSVWREVPRRAAVATLYAPAVLACGGPGTRLIGARWRFAYALGFLSEAAAAAGAWVRRGMTPAGATGGATAGATGGAHDGTAAAAGRWRRAQG